MGKLGRSYLRCGVKVGGNNIYDINQYVLSLRFTYILKLFNKSYV